MARVKKVGGSEKNTASKDIKLYVWANCCGKCGREFVFLGPRPKAELKDVNSEKHETYIALNILCPTCKSILRLKPFETLHEAKEYLAKRQLLLLVKGVMP